MKVALMISGQPRGIPLGCELLKKNIIEPNNIADIFYHAWHDEKNVGKSYDSAQPNQNGKVGFVKPKTAEFLENFFRPKKCLVEPQKEFPNLRNLIGEQSAIQEILGSSFYSSYTVNSLRKEYQQKENVKYDAIIKTRFDLFYEHKIVVNDYEKEIKENKIIVRKKFQDDQDNFKNPDMPMNDVFAIGNEYTIDIFCGVFPEMEVLNWEINPPFAENYLGRHVRVNNKIELHKANWNFEILHRVVDLSKI